MEKFSLNKKVLSSLDYNGMKNIQGGSNDDTEDHACDECDAWGSRICGTYFSTGGCSGTKNSKSCKETVPLCIPL
jgi:hypothetical protein